MSTPETDAFEPTHQISVHHWADFARALERRNSELTARIAELEKANAAIDACLNKRIEVIAKRNTEIAGLKEALAEARKDLVWQPIETAPKDGTPFLAYVIIDANMEDRAEAKITIASFDSTIDCFVQIDGSGNGYLEDETFYYWMPLPPLPETEGTI